MKRMIFFLLAMGAVSGNAHAETIRMDEVEVEGQVHKPEVMFITDRSGSVPDRDGIAALRENFLIKTLEEGRTIATQEAL